MARDRYSHLHPMLFSLVHVSTEAQFHLSGTTEIIQGQCWQLAMGLTPLESL